MHHRLRALTVGLFVLLLSVCLALPASLAEQKPSSILEAIQKALPTQSESPYIGTVVITKNGYQHARQSSTDSTIAFRVHYGERFLCTEDTGDGWYGILLPTDEIGYVSSSRENTSLLRGEVDGVTLSSIENLFDIKANKKIDIYSQPKSSAKMRRVSGDGATETTFYCDKGSELKSIGKTTRGNTDWYLLVFNNNGVYEMGWAIAADCTVTSGDPDAHIIPGEWYD